MTATTDPRLDYANRRSRARVRPFQAVGVAIVLGLIINLGIGSVIEAPLWLRFIIHGGVGFVLGCLFSWLGIRWRNREYARADEWMDSLPLEIEINSSGSVSEPRPYTTDLSPVTNSYLGLPRFLTIMGTVGNTVDNYEWYTQAALTSMQDSHGQRVYRATVDSHSADEVQVTYVSETYPDTVILIQFRPKKGSS